MVDGLIDTLKLLGLWVFIFWIAHQPRGHPLVNILFSGRHAWRYRYETPPLWKRRAVVVIEVFHGGSPLGPESPS